MSVLWRKVWRDLIHSKARTTLAVLSIGAGVFALGLALGALEVMHARIDADDRTTRPAHITFRGGAFGQDTFDRDLVASAIRKPGVADAEGEAYLPFRWKLENESGWRAGVLVARGDYAAQRIGVVELLDGEWPGDHTLDVEIKSLQYFNVPIGSTILVEGGNGEQRLKVVGVIRKPYVLQPQFGGDATFFTAPDTAEWLTGVEGFNKLRVRLNGNDAQAAEPVRNWMEGMGFSVAGTGATGVTDEFDAADTKDILTAVFLILIVMGVLSLGLSAFLIVNTMNAIVAGQVWQIGVMKVLGGTSGRVARFYLSTALIYGVLALVLAVLPAALGAHFMAGWMLEMMNNITASGPMQVSPAAVGAQAGVAIIVPLLAALAPALGGARITPREAISSYGVGAGFGSSPLDRVIARVRSISRPMAISLRSTFRRKARVALTLTTLTFVGVIFIVTISVRESLDASLDHLLARFHYDVLAVFSRPYHAAQLADATANLPGVAGVEVWDMRRARLSVDGGETEIGVYGVPPDTAMLDFEMVSGRRLAPDDGNAIVLNNGLAQDIGAHVGDGVSLTIAGKETRWKVVGLMLSATVGQGDNYVPLDALARETGSVNRGSIVVVMTGHHDAETQRRVMDALEDTYAARRIETASLQSANEFREQSQIVFDVIAYLLLTMALVAAVVGGVGLMGTLSINVVERRREIGVMRAIGASTLDVAGIFVGEGVLLGVISWLLAVPISYPGARAFANGVGVALFAAPLDFHYSLGGAIAWLIVVIALSAFASLWPALQAARMSVREAVAYE